MLVYFIGIFKARLFPSGIGARLPLSSPGSCLVQCDIVSLKHSSCFSDNSCIGRSLALLLHSVEYFTFSIFKSWLANWWPVFPYLMHRLLFVVEVLIPLWEWADWMLSFFSRPIFNRSEQIHFLALLVYISCLFRIHIWFIAEVLECLLQRIDHLSRVVSLIR